ncbi:MAG TPA: fructosamine kinase, partial [Porphyromonadaceae bacterium]|nr:fructosamine kinase [Porphyromonadaceae bacterium]
LFGGFTSSFYDAYHEIIPKSGSDGQQIELYQLYYLLVHLNLFGSGYYSSVTSILQRYF